MGKSKGGGQCGSYGDARLTGRVMKLLQGRSFNHLLGGDVDIVNPGAQCRARDSIGRVDKRSRAVDDGLSSVKCPVKRRCIVNGRLTTEDFEFRKVRR